MQNGWQGCYFVSMTFVMEYCVMAVGRQWDGGQLVVPRSVGKTAGFGDYSSETGFVPGEDNVFKWTGSELLPSAGKSSCWTGFSVKWNWCKFAVQCVCMCVHMCVCVTWHMSYSSYDWNVGLTSQVFELLVLKTYVKSVLLCSGIVLFCSFTWTSE